MPQGQSTAAAPSGQRRQRKSEGRPRLDATAAKLSEDRRIQIRRAQKTYRLKKDACIQSSQQRVCELEHKLTEIGQLLREHRDMLQATLHGTHPELLGGCERILDRLKIIPGGHQVDISNSVTRVESSKQLTNYCSSAVPQNDQASNFAASGYQDIPDLALSKYSAMRKSPNLSGDTEGMMLPAASNSRESCSNTERKNPRSETVDRSVGAQLNYTYSFLETSFARRLKRFSLEYAFQVYDDPHSDPHEVFRLFRLVPCFRERAKMYPYFKELVTSNRGHSLEISSLPFYTIGGAGTHYADIDDTGNPMYPSNMRVPRRILGILPMSREGDPQNDISQTQQAQLELCGFGGDWFDCRDVEGYLKARGVQLDESTVCPSMRYVPSDSGPGGESRNVSFDLEYFTERLRSCMAILGRAPGFRRSDVDIAFHAAVKM